MRRETVSHLKELANPLRIYPEAQRHGRSDIVRGKDAPSLAAPPAERTTQRSRMRQVEDSLVATVLDSHPNTTRALDRLLDDIAGAGIPAVCGCGPSVQDQSISSDEVEEQLFQLILDRHPRREKALLRLLAGLGQPLAGKQRPTDPTPAGAEESAEQDAERWSGLEQLVRL